MGAEPHRGTILLLLLLHLPVYRGTGKGGFEPAAAATLNWGSGNRLRAAEEVGEAALGHGGPGSDPGPGNDPGPGAPTRAPALPGAPKPPRLAGTRAAAAPPTAGGGWWCREESRGAELAPLSS